MQAIGPAARAGSLPLGAGGAASPSAGTPTSAKSEGTEAGTAPAFSFDIPALCPVTAKFLQVPHTRLQAHAAHGMFGAPVSIVAQFSVPLPILCDCRCAEYRQFVKGIFQVDGRDALETCTGPLDRTTFQEDCALGVPMPGGKSVIGHRDTPLPGLSVYSDPDQETGCRFEGSDFPGAVDVEKPVFVEMHVEFKSQLVDTCNGNAVLAQSMWGVDGEDTVQP